MEELSKDELWAIYETLPETLKDAIFSEDTSDAIWNVCKLYDINEVAKVSKIISQILMGLLPPQFLEDSLKDELKLKESTAKKATMDLEHYILNQYKEELDALYEGVVDKEEAQKKAQNKQEKNTGPDKYREVV